MKKIVIYLWNNIIKQDINVSNIIIKFLLFLDICEFVNIIVSMITTVFTTKFSKKI